MSYIVRTPQPMSYIINSHRYAGPWSPADIEVSASMVSWHDASDTSTIDDSTATPDVDQWDDLSSNGNDVTQSTASAKPHTGATVNGLNAITFDGSNDVLSTTASDIGSGGIPWTICMTIQPAAGSAGTGIPFGYIDSAITGLAAAFSVEDNSANNEFCFRSYLNGFRDGGSGAAWTAGTTYVISFDMPDLSGANNYSNLVQYQDGTSVAHTAGHTTSGTFASGAKTLSLGAINGADFTSCTLCEVAFFSTQLSTSDRQKMEGYMAHKWGVTLPGGHPYASSPP